MSETKKVYPKPSVTVDLAVLTNEALPRLLLVRRGRDPYAGCWALPGGFVEEYESVDLAACRELTEETGVAGLVPTLYGVYGERGRDPRGWTISCAYHARLSPDDAKACAGDDAADARFFAVGAVLTGLKLRLSLHNADLTLRSEIPLIKKADGVLCADRSLPLLPPTDENALAFDHARLIGDALLHIGLVKER